MPIFRLPQQQGNGLGTIIERVASSGASRAILFETSVALDLVQSQRKTSINPNGTSLGGDRSSALGIVS